METYTFKRSIQDKNYENNDYISRNKKLFSNSKYLVSTDNKNLFSNNKNLFSNNKNLFPNNKNLFAKNKNLFSKNKNPIVTNDFIIDKKKRRYNTPALKKKTLPPKKKTSSTIKKKNHYKPYDAEIFKNHYGMVKYQDTDGKNIKLTFNLFTKKWTFWVNGYLRIQNAKVTWMDTGRVTIKGTSCGDWSGKALSIVPFEEKARIFYLMTILAFDTLKKKKIQNKKKKIKLRRTIAKVEPMLNLIIRKNDPQSIDLIDYSKYGIYGVKRYFKDMITKTGIDQRTPLHESIFNKKCSVMVTKTLLSWGAPVDARDWRGNTPLHYASAFNNDQKLYWLIKYNADLNAQNKDGYTPLHVACKQGNIKIVKLLVKNGALVNMKNKFLYTALHFACEKKIDGLVYFLLKNGAHVY